LADARCGDFLRGARGASQTKARAAGGVFRRVRFDAATVSAASISIHSI
jgi:hypothetical protein